MKRKIYAISLLLSFLMALSHEMIPHHHHDEFAHEFSSSHSHKQTHTHHDHHHHHHNGKGEHHKDTQDKNDLHKHTFPHHHPLAFHDFDFTKRTINGSSLLKYHTLPFLSYENILGLLIKPPDKELSNYADGPFPIISLFEPGATGLRAPPSIA